MPWAIGSPEGGHDAIHPDLGTHRRLRRVRAPGHGRLKVALDFALQCSPDHPWVQKHPERVHHRADGSIAYAENPPKKYQDIYPIAFDQDMPGLIQETLRVLRHWMDHGADLPRRQPAHQAADLWERVIADINRTDPDVIFLAEAFTRPAIMHTLAAVGFQQSYTYFTWRNTKQELTDYLTELSGATAAFMRPNLFVNTPDIPAGHLQRGGRPSRYAPCSPPPSRPRGGSTPGTSCARALPVGPASEVPEDQGRLHHDRRESAAREGRTIAPLITELNRIRRRHKALHALRNLHFHQTDNEALIAYGKHSATRSWWWPT